MTFLINSKGRIRIRVTGIYSDPDPEGSCPAGRIHSWRARPGRWEAGGRRAAEPACPDSCIQQIMCCGSGSCRIRTFYAESESFSADRFTLVSSIGELIGSWTKNINGQIIKSARKNVCNYSTRKFDFKQNESRMVKYENTNKLGSIAEPDPTLRFP